MITIGQLAGYAGVSVKTVRVYHAKGLLDEPERDASNYRRYTASHVVELIRIRTLVEAGVPLARIRELRDSGTAELQRELRRVDAGLDERIQALRTAQRRLRQLAEGRLPAVPAAVGDHLARLTGWGFTRRWVDLQRDLWILVFATHPDTAAVLFADQTETLADPATRQIFLDYDQAYDWEPLDNRIDDLARRIDEATRSRYGPAGLPGPDAGSEVPNLIQQTVNAASPAWQRLDALIREHLRDAYL